MSLTNAFRLASHSNSISSDFLGESVANVGNAASERYERFG
jgi:hypothetical protein